MSSKRILLRMSSLGLACGLALTAAASINAFAASGKVHITNDMVKDGALKSSANVGGGVWDYGTRVVGLRTKECYSNYYHETNRHSSTAKIGTQSSGKVVADAGKTSYASVRGGLTDVAHAFWDNDA